MQLLCMQALSLDVNDFSYLLGDLRALESRHQASRCCGGSRRERGIVGDEKGEVVAAKLRQLARQVRALQYGMQGINTSFMLLQPSFESRLASSLHVTCPP